MQLSKSKSVWVVQVRSRSNPATRVGVAIKIAPVTCSLRSNSATFSFPRILCPSAVFRSSYLIVSSFRKSFKEAVQKSSVHTTFVWKTVLSKRVNFMKSLKKHLSTDGSQLEKSVIILRKIVQVMRWQLQPFER